MWDGNFLITADEEEVAKIQTPILILMGDDLYHPQSTSRKIATLAPNATLIEKWKDIKYLDTVNSSIIEFLKRHS
jgi:predicted alpha/beta hydrolase